MSLASPSRNGLHLHLIIEVDFPCRVFGVFFRLLRYHGGRFHESSVAPEYTSARQTNVVVSVFSDASDIATTIPFLRGRVLYTNFVTDS